MMRFFKKLFAGGRDGNSGFVSFRPGFTLTIGGPVPPEIRGEDGGIVTGRRSEPLEAERLGAAQVTALCGAGPVEVRNLRSYFIEADARSRRFHRMLTGERLPIFGHGGFPSRTASLLRAQWLRLASFLSPRNGRGEK